MTELVKLPTLGFGPGHDVSVLTLSTTWGSVLSMESLKILSPSASVPPNTCTLNKETNEQNLMKRRIRVLISVTGHMVIAGILPATLAAHSTLHSL